jgi:hypothetical protein
MAPFYDLLSLRKNKGACGAFQKKPKALSQKPPFRHNLPLYK